jgi:hypothetical protein
MAYPDMSFYSITSSAIAACVAGISNFHNLSFYFTFSHTRVFTLIFPSLGNGAGLVV